MVTCIIFSKDRPLQLDLCIHSIKTNFNDASSITVIEKYSEQYQESLEILKTEHKDVKFVKQTECIYQDVAESATQKYTCFFTDDDIVFRKTSIGHDLDKIFAAPGVSCFSLRLGKNIDVRYHNGYKLEQNIAQHQIIQNYIFVPKTLYPYGNYWGYSHSVDGHIFKSQEVINMFTEMSYLSKKFNFRQTPNEVETQMQRYWALSGNFIVCLAHSVVVNSPNNRVSDTHTENFSGEHFMYEPEFLLGKYMNNKRVDLDGLDFSAIVCPHQEIAIVDALYDRA